MSFTVRPEDGYHGAFAHDGVDSIGTADHIAGLEVSAIMTIRSGDGKHVGTRAESGSGTPARAKERLNAGLMLVFFTKRSQTF